MYALLIGKAPTQGKQAPCIDDALQWARWRTEAQGSINRIEIESLGIERPADPNKHAVVLLVRRIFDGGEEFFVAHHATDIVRWSGTFTGNAQWIEPVGLWVGDRGDFYPMTPTVAEVVFVDKFAD